MKIKNFLLISASLFLLIQCGDSTKKNENTNDTSNSEGAGVLKDSINMSNEIAMQSEITCPKCGYKKMEKLPTDVCVLKYNCEKCQEEMRPKEGDCCIFCTYGTHKCPSMQ